MTSFAGCLQFPPTEASAVSNLTAKRLMCLSNSQHQAVPTKLHCVYTVYSSEHIEVYSMVHGASSTSPMLTFCIAMNAIFLQRMVATSNAVVSVTARRLMPIAIHFLLFWSLLAPMTCSFSIVESRTVSGPVIVCTATSQTFWRT